MQVEVLIGVPRPDKVDTAEVLKILPHGTGTVKVVEGGLEIANEAGTDKTVIAQAAAIVRLDLRGGPAWLPNASSSSSAPATTCMAATTPRRRCAPCRTRCITARSP